MPYTHMIAERLNFLAIDPNTTSEIRKAKEIIEPEIDVMLDRFYDHILKQPELRKLFIDNDAIKRARTGQKNHWLNSLFNGKYDNAYFENVEQIGRAHARVGLTPDWYIGGYCQMLCQFIQLITEKCAGDEKTTARFVKSISKAIFLDMDLVTLCYLDAKDSSMRQILHRATNLWNDVTTLNEELTETVQKIQGAIKASSTDTGIRSEAVDFEHNQSKPTLDKEDSGRKESEYELDTLISRLSQQTAQLGNRLNDFKFSDRLYIEDDLAKTGTIARLKALIFRKG